MLMMLALWAKPGPADAHDVARWAKPGPADAHDAGALGQARSS